MYLWDLYLIYLDLDKRRVTIEERKGFVVSSVCDYIWSQFFKKFSPVGKCDRSTCNFRLTAKLTIDATLRVRYCLGRCSKSYCRLKLDRVSRCFYSAPLHTYTNLATLRVIFSVEKRERLRSFQMQDQKAFQCRGELRNYKIKEHGVLGVTRSSTAKERKIFTEMVSKGGKFFKHVS